MIALGDKVKDVITGYEGVVVSRTEWLYGCVRLQVQPERLLKGEPQEAKVFDEPQLKLIKRGVVANAQPKQDEPRTYGARDDKVALSR